MKSDYANILFSANVHGPFTHIKTNKQLLREYAVLPTVELMFMASGPHCHSIVYMGVARKHPEISNQHS